MEINKHVIRVTKLLVKQALTDEPYKKKFKIGELPTTAATPIIKIPVPKKKLDAIDTPKYLLKITFKNVYKLDHPNDITILERIEINKE